MTQRTKSEADRDIGLQQRAPTRLPRPPRAIRGARTVILLAIALAATGLLPGVSSVARAATTCTWAGTPASPTGTFTIRPGVTNTPSLGPLRFMATGQLAGGPGCRGTLTFVGDLAPGATCALATFQGRVEGLPGVARFWGQGSLLVPSRLLDNEGHLVGIENANIMTPANLPRTKDCATPQGFEGGWPGMFSSVLYLLGAS
jgi:hypothetical protein